MAPPTTQRIHMDAQRQGPLRWWLHKLGKAASPACPCGYHRQGGYHITFPYPIHATERRKLIGAGKTTVENPWTTKSTSRTRSQAGRSITTEWKPFSAISSPTSLRGDSIILYILAQGLRGDSIILYILAQGPGD